MTFTGNRLWRLALSLAFLSFAFSAVSADREKMEVELKAAREAFHQGMVEKALKHVHKAIIADPTEPRCYFSAGQIHQSMRESAEAIAAYTKTLELAPSATDAYRNRGMEHFKLGHVRESIEDFNQELKLEPAGRAHHWMRGLSYYYAGLFLDGQRQFEIHQTVNPNDVENAVWHFLCAAKASGIEKAQANYMPIQGDSRVPMMEIYKLYGGKGTIEEVMEAAKQGQPRQLELRNRLFFAHLYLALYFDVKGDSKAMREHIDKACGEYAQKHYMGDVARVHKMMLEGKLSHQNKLAPAKGAPAAKKGKPATAPSTNTKSKPAPKKKTKPKQEK